MSPVNGKADPPAATLIFICCAPDAVVLGTNEISTSTGLAL